MIFREVPVLGTGRTHVSQLPRFSQPKLKPLGIWVETFHIVNGTVRVKNDAVRYSHCLVGGKDTAGGRPAPPALSQFDKRGFCPDRWSLTSPCHALFTLPGFWWQILQVFAPEIPGSFTSFRTVTPNYGLWPLTHNNLAPVLTRNTNKSSPNCDHTVPNAWLNPCVCFPL